MSAGDGDLLADDGSLLAGDGDSFAGGGSLSRPEQRGSTVADIGEGASAMEGAIRDGIQEVVRQQVGHAATVSRIQRWGGGALNECYRIAVQNPSCELFLKMEKAHVGRGGALGTSGAKDQSGASSGGGVRASCLPATFVPTTRRGQIEREVEGVRLASAAGIPTAPIVGYDLSGQHVGCKYILQEYVDAELLFTIDEYIEDSEDEQIRAQISDIMGKMEAIRAPWFGDVYEGGVLGRHPTWRGAFAAMRALLLGDLEVLDVFKPADLQVISDALAWGSEQIGCGHVGSDQAGSEHVGCAQTESEQAVHQPSALIHTDLGKHNVLVERANGSVKIRAVTDFGNSMFGPYYIEEHLIREFGGWRMGPADIPAAYGITPEEFTATQLLFGLELGVFTFALNPSLASLQANHPGGFLDRYREVLKQ